MKKLKFPTAQTILLIIAGLVTLLTWMVPAGKYSTLQFDKDTSVFVYKSTESSNTLKATQSTLDSLSIKIPVEKFTSGDIWKPIAVPGTYRELKPNPQSFLDFLKSPEARAVFETYGFSAK